MNLLGLILFVSEFLKVLCFSFKASLTREISSFKSVPLEKYYCFINSQSALIITSSLIIGAGNLGPILKSDRFKTAVN